MLKSKEKPSHPKREFWGVWWVSVVSTHPVVLCSSAGPVPLVPASSTKTFECFTTSFVRFKCLHIFHLQKPHERDILPVWSCRMLKREQVTHNSSFKFCCFVVFEQKISTISEKHAQILAFPLIRLGVITSGASTLKPWTELQSGKATKL